MLKYFKYSAALFLFINVAFAEPYINTSDLTLRASINHLANAGYINTPVNTYPLMWIDINRELKHINPQHLSENEKKSYFYIQSLFIKAPRKKIKLKANTSNKNIRFKSFGDNFYNRNTMTISANQAMDYIAYKLSPTFSLDPLDGDKIQFNDSYIATRLGNWNFAIGTQERWWGPGWDTNVALTNNARPMLSASVTRNISHPFEVPFTDSYKIPWNVTSFMGKMEEDRFIPNTLLWGFRLNFIPIENLEISLVRLAQWGGDGRSQSLSTFVDVFVGLDNCGASGLDCGINKENEPGNQQAGYDFRYSFNLFNNPMSIYGQYFGEDGNADSGLNFITEPATQIGVDAQFSLFDSPATFFAEYTDTFQSCNEITPHIGNCFYEHHIYQTGMRYKQRNIGNLYDNDAYSHVIGLIGHTNDVNWDIKLKHIELNKDNLDRYPDHPNGNTVSEIAENLWLLSGNFHKNIGQFSYKISTDYSYSRYIEKPSKQEFQISLAVFYTL